MCLRSKTLIFKWLLFYCVIRYYLYATRYRCYHCISVYYYTYQYYNIYRFYTYRLYYSYNLYGFIWLLLHVLYNKNGVENENTI